MAFFKSVSGRAFDLKMREGRVKGLWKLLNMSRGTVAIQGDVEMVAERLADLNDSSSLVSWLHVFLFRGKD